MFGWVFTPLNVYFWPDRCCPEVNYLSIVCREHQDKPKDRIGLMSNSGESTWKWFIYEGERKCSCAIFSLKLFISTLCFSVARRWLNHVLWLWVAFWNWQTSSRISPLENPDAARVRIVSQFSPVTFQIRQLVNWCAASSLLLEIRVVCSPLLKWIWN